MSDRMLQIGTTVRHSHQSSLERMLEGYLNYKFLGRSPVEGGPQLILLSGINAAKEIAGPDGRRRPVIAIRSAPLRAGTAGNPWHDEIDLDHGHIRYFGDHKATTTGPVGSTKGNMALLQAWEQHASTDEAERRAAPPILVFQARPEHLDSGRVSYGYLDFCGVAVIERLEFIVQRDPVTGRSFPNLAVDLAVLRLDNDDAVDFRWIDDRRTPQLDAAQTERFAPASWTTWVRRGRVAVPGLRRRVLSSRVLSREQQLPPADTPEADVLQRIYSFYDGRKHAFEQAAAIIAAEILREGGGQYAAGWLTKSGGDGGLDFVGRLDVGVGAGSTPLVVLGQAKCVQPSTGISPDQVARLVARLRRGWLGVFVTTGTFSKQAQVEIVDDAYPVVLVSGGRLASTVRRLVESSYGGDLEKFLTSTLEDYPDAVTHRLPHEVLGAG